MKKHHLAALLLGLCGTALAAATNTNCWVSGAYGRTAAQEAACSDALAESVKQQMVQNAKRAAEIEQLTKANRQSVLDCSSSLSAESGADAVSQTLACLRANPYAGSEAAEAFGVAYGPLIDQLSATAPELKSDFDSLQAQKAKKLYWSVLTNRGHAIFVGEKYLFGDPIVQAQDLSALNVKVVTTSRVFGTDEATPLDQFKAISFKASPSVKSGNIGKNKVTLASGEVIIDDSYQAFFPIRHYNGEEWSALTEIIGTAYVDGDRGAMVKPNSSLPLKLTAISDSSIMLIDSDMAAREIAQIEAKIRAANEKAEAEKRQAKDERETLLERLRTAAKGDEDSCQGYMRASDPLADSMRVTCQFLQGTIELGAIKTHGWLIANVTHLNDGKGTALITVRKAR